MRRLLALALLAGSLVGLSASTTHAASPTLRLYYLADIGSPGVYGLWSRDLAGGEPTQLVAGHAGIDMGFAQVSPDGTQIAYTLTDAHATQLWTVEASGAGAQRLRVFASRDSAFGIRWSPDGTSILFNDTDSPDPRVRVFHLASRATTVVPHTDFFANPTVDPSSPTFMVGNRPGDKVVRQAADGATAPTAVLGSPLDTARPVVSADGATVAFTHVTDRSESAPQAEIMSLHAGARKVLATGDFNARPTLGPDGNVYFDKVADQAHGFRGDLWSVPIDGSSAATQLTSTPDVDEYSASVGVVDDVAPAGVVSNLRIGLASVYPQLSWNLPEDASDVVVCRVAGTTAPSAPCDKPVYRGPGTSFRDSLWPSSINLVYSWSVFTADRFGNVNPTPVSITARLIGAVRANIALPVSVNTASPPFFVSWGSERAPAGTTYTVTWAVRTAPTGPLGPFKPWRTTTETSEVFGGAGRPTALKPGETYYLRFQTGDEFGNKTLITTSRGVVPFDQTVAHYSAGWRNESSSGRWLGDVAGTTRAGATAIVTLVGSDIGVIGERCTTCGQFRLYLDGTYKGTLDTHASRYVGRQNLWTFHFPMIGTHKVTIVAVGTAGHPRVNLDGFAAWR